MLKNLLILILLGIGGTLTAQNIQKEKGAIRILSYNTHYCKGATDPGTINKENTLRLAQVIATMNPDIIALQELDSASVHRGSRYLLKDIANATGIEYVPVYGNAAPFDHGSIGCGVLIKKNLKIKNSEIIHLPGDETRAAVKIELKNLVFIGTHSDLNNAKRIEGAEIVCNAIKNETKPVFVAGDLNDSHLWANGGISFPTWLKSFKIISDTTGNSIPGRNDNNGLIDYVLLSEKTSKKVKVIQSHIIQSITIDGKSVDTATISDHYPIFVDIKL